MPDFGELEGQQNPLADFGRVDDALEAGRLHRPLVMAEIGVVGPGRQDQIIVAEVDAVRAHDLLLEIDALDFSEHHPDVRAPREDAPDRPRDIGGRKRGGRDLIEERLEEMVVPLVDDGDVEGPFARRLAAARPPKPAPTITTRGRGDFVAICSMGLDLRTDPGAAASSIVAPTAPEIFPLADSFSAVREAFYRESDHARRLAQIFNCA